MGDDNCGLEVQYTLVAGADGQPSNRLNFRSKPLLPRMWPVLDLEPIPDVCTDVHYASGTFYVMDKFCDGTQTVRVVGGWCGACVCVCGGGIHTHTHTHT
jgi:hypothetical protein